MRRFLLAVLIFGGALLLGYALRPTAPVRTTYPVPTYMVGYAPYYPPTVIELEVEVPQP